MALEIYTKESLKFLIIHQLKNESLLIKLMKLLLTLLLIVFNQRNSMLFPHNSSALSRILSKDVWLDTEEQVAVKSFYICISIVFSYIQRYTYLHNITSFAIIIITELNLKHT